MNDILSLLELYEPFNEQERADKGVMLALLSERADLFTRDNRTAHFTASAWVANVRRDRVLMAYHNIYNSWSWLGGHADGDRNLLAVAMREVREESGLAEVRALSERLFSVEILTVDGHEKRGAYVPSHLHLNATFLLEADDGAPLHEKADENSGVRWFSLDDAVEATSEQWFKTRIYPKLNEKLKAFR